MPVNDALLIDLSAVEISEFMFDDSRSSFSSDILMEAGFSKNAERAIPSVNTRHWIMTTETWAVMNRYKTIISQFTADVPVSWELKVDATSHLLIKESINSSDRAYIVSAFQSYDFAVHGTISDYINQMLTPTINESMFLIKTSFSLTKIPGTRKSDLSSLNAMKNLYAPVEIAPGQTLPNPGKIEMPGLEQDLWAYFEKHGIWLKEISKTLSHGTQSDSTDRIPVADADDPNTAISETIEAAKKINGCEFIERTRHKVASMTTFIEVQIRAIDAVLVDNCGMRVTVRSHALFKRDVYLVLWAWFATTDQVLQGFGAALNSCLIRSALNPVVVATAFLNAKAAVIMFTTLFFDCVRYNASDSLRCVLPDITVTEERGQWSRV